MKRITCVFFIVSCSFPLFGLGNKQIKSYQTSRRLLTWLYADNNVNNLKNVTLYCNCSFKGKSVEHRSCGYTPRSHKHRAQRIEWEHIVPASVIGKTFDAWQNRHRYSACRRISNRSCAEKISAEFRMIEADLYNLYPSIGEVNLFRSNFSHGVISGEERKFGSCDFEVKNRLAEPRNDIRGDIARTYFYMAWAYPKRIVLSELQQQKFEDWSAKDPISHEERKKAKAIFKTQGNCNPWVLECSEITK